MKTPMHVFPRYSSHIALAARDNVMGKFSIIHQYIVQLYLLYELLYNNNNSNSNNNSVSKPKISQIVLIYVNEYAKYFRQLQAKYE